MPVGNRRQPPEARIAKHLVLAPQDLARRQARHLLECLVDLRQQTDVRAAVLARKRPAAAASTPIPDRPRLAPLPDQTLHLLVRKAGRDQQKLQHHPLVPLAELHIAEAHQRLPNKGVNAVPILGLKDHRLVALDEGTKLPDGA